MLNKDEDGLVFYQYTLMFVIVFDIFFLFYLMDHTCWALVPSLLEKDIVFFPQNNGGSA